jgi:hypothetical protein
MMETKMGKSPKQFSNVTELMPNRIEVWSGVPKGTTTKTWFVSSWEDGSEFIVFDGYSEADALEAAEDWDLPIIISR